MDPAEWFASLVRQPSGATTLDVLAGLIGVCFEPDTDIGAVSLELDHLAAGLEPTFPAVLSLFADRLVGNTADYSDPRNSYLHQVIQRGLGIPITLSVCAMEVGRRLGLPVVGIGLPGHFMIECAGMFADPFRGGAEVTLDQLERVWQRNTGTTARLDPRFLAPVPDRAIVLRMLNNLKQTFVAMDEPGPLRTLSMLRGAFPELAHEDAEYRRWLRHLN
ncbi:MAG: hypothetical protein RL219_2199 [Actinomycetota bacterium]